MTTERTKNSPLHAFRQDKQIGCCWPTITTEASAFSSEVDTGSHEGNASDPNHRAKLLSL
jgi:hypothetical protein